MAVRAEERKVIQAWAGAVGGDQDEGAAEGVRGDNLGGGREPLGGSSRVVSPALPIFGAEKAVEVAGFLEGCVFRAKCRLLVGVFLGSASL